MLLDSSNENYYEQYQANAYDFCMFVDKCFIARTLMNYSRFRNCTCNDNASQFNQIVSNVYRLHAEYKINIELYVKSLILKHQNGGSITTPDCVQYFLDETTKTLRNPIYGDTLLLDAVLNNCSLHDVFNCMLRNYEIQSESVKTSLKDYCRQLISKLHKTDVVNYKHLCDHFHNLSDKQTEEFDVFSTAREIYGEE